MCSSDLNVATLAFSDSVALLTASQTLLLITVASITLVAFHTTLITYNLNRSILTCRSPLIMHPLFALISWGTIRLRATLLFLTSAVTHHLVMSFRVLFVDPTTAYQLRKISYLLIANGVTPIFDYLII